MFSYRNVRIPHDWLLMTYRIIVGQLLSIPRYRDINEQEILQCLTWPRGPWKALQLWYDYNRICGNTGKDVKRTRTAVDDFDLRTAVCASNVLCMSPIFCACLDGALLPSGLWRSSKDHFPRLVELMCLSGNESLTIWYQWTECLGQQVLSRCLLRSRFVTRMNTRSRK